MTRHRLVCFLVGVGIVVLGRCAVGEAPREAPQVLKIKVIDAATGKAMPGVSLWYLAYSPNGHTHAETTALGLGGATRLTWSQVNKYYLTFSFSIDHRGLRVRRTVKATDANAASLILRIPTDRYKKPLVVTVLNAATGKPVPNARINLSFHDTGGAGSTAHERALTTAGGKASFNWAGEGKYRIWCSQIDGRKLAGFYRPSDLTDDEWKAGKLTWKIKVPKPSARVKVFLLSKGKKTPAPDGAIFGVRTAKETKTGTTSRELTAVCKNGKAQFYDLDAGSVNTFCILTKARTHKYVPIDVKPWTFKGKVLNLEVTLVPAGEYRAKLTVRVIDDRGTPVAGAGVDISGPAGGEGATNSAGVTAWSRLSIGRYTVTVRKRGYHVVIRRGVLLPRTDDLVIRLLKHHGLMVRVLGQDGEPVASAICLAVPLSQDAGKRIHKGRSRLKELYEGYYLVMATGDKGKGTIFERDRGGVVLDADRIAMVNIEPRKAHPVRIELTAAKGAKVPPKPLFTLVSLEAKDFLSDAGDKVMLVAAAYMVYLRMAPKQYVLLGKRTVTGANTIKLDLKGVNLDKANWVSEEDVLRQFLPKGRRATTRPARNRAATRASK